MTKDSIVFFYIADVTLTLQTEFQMLMLTFGIVETTADFLVLIFICLIIETIRILKYCVKDLKALHVDAATFPLPVGWRRQKPGLLQQQ